MTSGNVEKLTSELSSLRRLADLIEGEVTGGLREVPKLVQVYSDREQDREALEFLVDVLQEKLARRVSELGFSIPVILSPNPAKSYSFDLGFFLKAGRMPVSTPASPENGTESYMPRTPPKDRILGYILNGSVIDHIPVGRAWKLIDEDPLELRKAGLSTSFGFNYDRGYDGRGKHKGYKDVIKIEGKELSEKERQIIGIYTGSATITLVRAGAKHRKYEIQSPEAFEGVLSCVDRNCRGNKFHYAQNAALFSCDSCNRTFDHGQIRAAH